MMNQIKAMVDRDAKIHIVFNSTFYKRINVNENTKTNQPTIKRFSSELRL